MVFFLNNGKAAAQREGEISVESGGFVRSSDGVLSAGRGQDPLPNPSELG